MSIGYGSDYRGAVECRTLLQAIPPDQATLRLLLDRAKELSSKDLSLPERSKVDSEVVAQSGRIYQRVIACPPTQITETSDASNAQVKAPSAAVTGRMGVAIGPPRADQLGR